MHFENKRQHTHYMQINVFLENCFGRIVWTILSHYTVPPWYYIYYNIHSYAKKNIWNDFVVDS